MITADFRFLGMVLLYRGCLGAAPRVGDEVQFEAQIDGEPLIVVGLVGHVRTCSASDGTTTHHYHVELCLRPELLLPGTLIRIVRHVAKCREIIESSRLTCNQATRS